MSIASKKRRRWSRRVEQAREKRDMELRLHAEWIRSRAVAVFGSELPILVELRVQEAINGLIVESPERIIFREKRMAKRAQ